jgi:hypothetical protein
MSKWVFRKEKYYRRNNWPEEIDGMVADFSDVTLEPSMGWCGGYIVNKESCEEIKEGAEMSDGCKWCDRQGDWRVDCVFWGPGNTSVKSYTQEMKAQVKYCPVCGKSIKPRLTAKQVEILKALKVLGFNYVAKNTDEDESVVAFESKPHKGRVCWDNFDGRYLLITQEWICCLVSWADTEPLDILQTLRDNGVDA